MMEQLEIPQIAKATQKLKVVHLRSQKGQPYGSTCNCCCYCGIALGPYNPCAIWVANQEDFFNLPHEYRKCC